MAIKPTCLRCCNEFDKMGALVFGPPIDPEDVFVPKLHLCRKCYFKTLDFMGATPRFVAAERKRLST